MKKFWRDLRKLTKTSHLASMLVFEIALGSSAVLLLLKIFLEVSENLFASEVTALDTVIIHFIYSFRSPLLTTGMLLITQLGGNVLIGSAALVASVLLLTHQKKQAILFSFILLEGIGINLLLKELFHRPRPHLFPLVTETSYSFPSGHAMNSFVFYASLMYFVIRPIPHPQVRRILYSVCIVLIGAIGLSRIYLGAHYPSDVLAGFVGGMCWFILVLLIEKSVFFFTLFRQFETDN